MKISVYIATSLDGFIAKPDGDIGWLMESGIPGDKEDYGYADFISSVDCLVMGRNTYEKVLSFPEWPYDKKVILLSNTLTDDEIPEKIKEKVKLFKGTLQELISYLARNKKSRVYIDGGKTIQSFLANGFVTDITLTRIPILLGSGISLFGALPKEIKLNHISTKSFPSGFVQSVYEI